jgi:predicted phage-related endonuclease
MITHHPDLPWCATSTDGILAHPERSGYGCLEIKTTNAYAGDMWEEGPPRYPWCQLQHQMMCFGYEWGITAALIGGNKFVWYFVDLDRSFIHEQYEPKLLEFYECVQRNQDWELDPSDSTLGAVRSRWPRDEEDMICLGPEMLTWHTQREEASNLEKSAKDLKQEANIHLIAAIGTAGRAVLPGGVEYLYRADKRGVRRLVPRNVKEA